MKNKLKIQQNTLTQTCHILPKKAFFDTFSDPRLSKILKILSEKVSNNVLFSLMIFKISLSLEFEKRSNNGLFSLKIFKISLSLELEKVSNNGLFSLKIFKILLSLEFEKVSKKAFFGKI